MADFANVQPDEYKLLGRSFSAGRPFGIKGVTIHHMAGDLNASQCNGIWGANGCSAHYSVDRNGYIVQHVNDTDRAYACGGRNRHRTRQRHDHLHRARQQRQ